MSAGNEIARRYLDLLRVMFVVHTGEGGFVRGETCSNKQNPSASKALSAGQACAMNSAALREVLACAPEAGNCTPRHEVVV